MRLALVVGALVVGSACASDHGIGGLCGTPQQGFDIEEASVLQDGQAYWGMHDAVILDLDTELPAGAGWRVAGVDIMPLIPSSQFDAYNDGDSVTVEVWDADDPGSAPFSVTQTFHKGELDWQTVALTNPVTAPSGEQEQAWWNFPFVDTIPTTGMTSTRYLVGVHWPSGEPPLGYSNFNRPCDRNWTDYADGFGWVLNSDNGSLDECSWPMLRVNIEVLEQAAECEGESYAVE